MVAPEQHHQPQPSSPGVAYKPYHSHRRTASARSSIPSTTTGGSSLPSPRPAAAANGSGTSSESPLRRDYAPAIEASPDTASPMLRRPLVAAAPATSQDLLAAPPPLRKLQSKSTAPSQRMTTLSIAHARSSDHPSKSPEAEKSQVGPASNVATTGGHGSASNGSQALGSAAREHRKSPSLPPSSPVLPSEGASHSSLALTGRFNSRSTSNGTGHGRSNTATSIPVNFERFSFQVPVGKGISTAQALRMKELQEHSSSGSPSFSNFGGSSGGSSATPSRAQSPGPDPAVTRNGDVGPSMAGFDAMFASQQGQMKPSSSSKLMPPFSTQTRSSNFQPRGLTRSQMPEFLEAKSLIKARTKRRNGGSATAVQDQDREEERIRRRVEKLLAIHYPSLTDSPLHRVATTSSFSSSILSTLAPHSRFLTTLQKSSNLRAAEQILVPWQSDESIRLCPICNKTFGVGRRKHHCRACGRVVCASPEVVASPLSSAASPSVDSHGDGDAKCSNIVIRDERALAAASAGQGGGADQQILAIKDLPPEVSLEALLSQSKLGQSSTAASENVLEASQQGFRLCRYCKVIVRRGHHLLEESEAPDYIRMYEQLMLLQKEIEQSLPEFQELVMGLQKQDINSTLGVEAGPVAAGSGTSSSSHSSPSSRRGSTTGATLSRTALLQLQRDAASARKQLLANFANYDALARRIRDLPDGGNNSLKRIKDGVDRKAAAFLQMNMFPLQSLPKLDTAAPSAASSSGNALSTTVPGTKSTGSAGSTPASKQRMLTPAEEEQLAVLQEQRAQIASFLSRAQKERKLNDVVLLKRNVEELEQEIARIQAR